MKLILAAAGLAVIGLALIGGVRCYVRTFGEGDR